MGEQTLPLSFLLLLLSLFLSLSFSLSPFIALDAPSSSLAPAPRRPSSDREARARFLVMNSQPEHGSWRLRFNGTRFDRLDRIDSVDSTKSFDAMMSSIFDRFLFLFLFFFFENRRIVVEGCSIFIIHRLIFFRRKGGSGGSQMSLYGVRRNSKKLGSIEGTSLIQFQCRRQIEKSQFP